MSKWLKTLKVTADKGKGAPAASDPTFAKEYPALHEFMTLTVDDAGEERQPSSLLFFCEDGVFKVVLGERNRDASLWASGTSFQEALEALEAILQSGHAQWRVKGRRQPKK